MSIKPCRKLTKDDSEENVPPYVNIFENKGKKTLKIKESNFQVQKPEEYKWKEIIIKGKDRSKREGKKQHLTWSIKQNIGSVKRPIRRTNVGKLQPAPVQQSMPGEKHSTLPTALTGKFVVTQPLAPPRNPVFFSLSLSSLSLCLSRTAISFSSFLKPPTLPSPSSQSAAEELEACESETPRSCTITLPISLHLCANTSPLPSGGMTSPGFRPEPVLPCVPLRTHPPA